MNAKVPATCTLGLGCAHGGYFYASDTVRTPTKHVAKDGTATWKVRFRLHGKQTSETFVDERPAKKFAGWIDALGAAAAVAKLNEANQRSDCPTVDEIAEQFFPWKAERVRSDRTIADYRRDYRIWIKPVFGDLPADTVTEILVQNWVETMHTGLDWIDGHGKSPTPFGSKLSPKTIGHRHALLHSLFAYAASPAGQRTIQYNPCVGTDLPPRTKKPPKGLWPAEWQALQPALRQIDPDGADLADFLLATGWRISEGCALGAFAVEDYDELMYVTMGQVVRVNAKGQRVIVQDAKSDAGYDRRIKVDQETAAMIRRRMKNVKGNGLVFTNKGGYQWHYSNFMDRVWNPAVSLAQLDRRPTPHWLRHTHVGWLIIGKKTSLSEIQRRVGHESINTTNEVYGRMVDDVSDEALDAFALFRSQTPVRQLGHAVNGRTAGPPAADSTPALEAADS